MEFRIKPFKSNLRFKCDIVTPTSLIPVNDRTNPNDMKPQRFTLSPIKKSGAIETIDLSENHEDEDLGIWRSITFHHLSYLPYFVPNVMVVHGITCLP